MIKNRFYQPSEVSYKDIVPAYQAAFADEPWLEVSKCVDTESAQRCVGGLSRLAIREFCQTCQATTERPAYDANELIERFDALAETRPTVWYQERTEGGVALAAVAWQAAAQTVAEEKYADTPAMNDWLLSQFGDQPIVWLDEVFADKSVRDGANLARFGAMCGGFMQQFDGSVLAYRTINPAMVRAATRDFSSNATIYTREQDVPDRRDFVVIAREEK